MAHYSYHPLDIGFDPRVHADMAVDLPADATSVTIADRSRVSGDWATLAAALVSDGLRVRCATAHGTGTIVRVYDGLYGDRRATIIMDDGSASAYAADGTRHYILADSRRAYIRAA
jgi:hypothetical protein